MMIKCFLVSVLMCLGVNCFGQEKVSEPDYEFVDKMIANNDFIGALSYADSLLLVEPNNCIFNFLKGYIFKIGYELNFKKADYKISKEFLKKSIEIKSDLLPAYRQLIELEMFAYKYDLAIKVADNMLDVFEANYDALSMAYNCKAYCLIHKRDLETSVGFFIKALKYNKYNQEAYAGLSWAYSDLNKNELAIQTCEECLKFVREDYGCLSNIALIYSEIEEYGKSVNIYNQLISKTPNAVSYSNRGLALGMLGNYEKSFTDFEISIEKYPLNSYVYRNRALVYLKKGEVDKACADLEHAKDLDFEKLFGNEVFLLIEKHCNK